MFWPMPSTTSPDTSRSDARTRLLDAALYVIRAKGYSATRVDDICIEAGLTKGAFFHHFASKEALALAAAQHFSDTADELFASAPYQLLADPLDRLMAYVDFRIALLEGDLPDITCLLGTMVQETYGTHPPIRDACERFIRSHAADVARDIAAAKRLYAPHATWSAEGLGLHMQAVIQGGFILAKAASNASLAADSIRHLKRYLETLFTKQSHH
jgi:TetR/AcrR family transcriptional regulator, transcriptional repressor for nem operon